MDKMTMDEFYAHGSGGSDKSRPLNEELRYARQARRTHDSRQRAPRKRARSENETTSPEQLRTMDCSTTPTTETTPNDRAVAASATPLLTPTQPRTSLHAPQGGGEGQRGSAKRTKRHMTPRPPPALVSLPPPPAEQPLGSTGAGEDKGAAALSSQRSSTPQTPPADITRLVAAVERQVAVAEEQLRVSAQQQALLGALLGASHDEAMPPTTPTRASPDQATATKQRTPRTP